MEISFSFILLLVLCVDGFDLLLDEVHVILEFLHLPVHLVNETVAFLGGGIQETEVVLIGLYLLLEGLVLTEQT